MTPSENSNVMNNQDNSLKIKIKIGREDRKRRLSSSPTSPPSYSSSLSPGRGEGGKRGRGGMRGRGRGKRRGGGIHDWENSRTWVCAICGQYDPVHAAGATTEWIGCDCNRSVSNVLIKWHWELKKYLSFKHLS